MPDPPAPSGASSRWGTSSPSRTGPRAAGLLRRGGTWLAWWAALLVIWVITDDSIGRDELLAGAGAAALAAFLAEAAGHQAGIRYRFRLSWLAAAVRLPGRVAVETFIVFAALARRLACGQQPPSGFAAEPAPAGPPGAEGRTWRALATGAASLSPNSFALGVDTERGVMVVHKLVLPRAGGAVLPHQETTAP